MRLSFPEKTHRDGAPTITRALVPKSYKLMSFNY
jgi:hypothetical protein